jgi:hypothetical protein
VDVRRGRLVLGLAAVQLADAAFNAVADEWVKDDLDHLGFPKDLRAIFPIIKTASSVGLLIGLRRPRLGRTTAVALVAYFLIALGFHVRAKDRLVQYVPAAAMLGWSALVLRSFRRSAQSV